MRSILPLAASVLVFGTAAARAQAPVTLEEAYRLTLARSEALAAEGEGVKRLEAERRRLGAAFRPELALLASETAAHNAAGRGQAGVNLSYDLFSGLQDYLAARAAGERTEAARAALLRARQRLYLDAAAAYSELASRRAQVAVRRRQLEVAAGRIKELEGRAAIGRSRQSELVAARAQLAQDEAALAAELSRETAAQIALAFLTGEEGPFAPAAQALPRLPDLAQALAAAAARPDVAAARKTLAAAKAGREAAGRLWLPTLGLSANYYLLRSAPNEDDRWDAGLALRVPLYTGGRNAAAADGANAAEKAADLALRLAERAALSEIRQEHAALEQALAVAASLRKALALAEENARLQAKDYLYGLVNNLDVLNAQNSVLQTALSLEAADAAAVLAGARLETAAGLRKD